MSLRMLRSEELLQKIGLKKSAIFDKLNPRSPRYDASFPRPVKLVAGVNSWVESEIEAWLEARIRASRQEVAA